MLKEEIYWISSSIMKNVGFKTIIKLYDQFGSMRKAWEANDKEILNLFPPNSEQAKAFINTRKIKNALKETWIEILKDEKIKIIKYIDNNYPNCFKELKDPPILIYCKGNIELLKQSGYAIVGTRTPSDKGCNNAKEIGNKIAENNDIHISGLALGIDSCGHKGALEADGKSIGVLGSGTLDIFPKENISLANKLLRKKGLLITESPPHYKVSSFQLKNRNRLIAALSKSLVVVEATENSGSLIAARYARDLGRELYVLGPIDSNNELHQGLLRIIERGNAIEFDINELLNRISIKGELKPIKISKVKQSDEKSSYGEDDFVKEIIRVIANSPTIGREKIKYLTDLKLHKLSFKIIESLKLDVTRSWYLRGCYVHNKIINKDSLKGFLNVPSLIPELRKNIENDLEKMLKVENIVHIKSEDYLKQLYEKETPLEYRNIYVSHFKILNLLKNYEKQKKHGTSLDDWGLNHNNRNLELMLINDYIEYCGQINNVKNDIPQIEKILFLLFENNKKLINSQNFKSLESLYSDTVWHIIAANISVKTIQGPRCKEITLDMKKRFIDNSQNILLETLRRIENSI